MMISYHGSLFLGMITLLILQGPAQADGDKTLRAQVEPVIQAQAELNAAKARLELSRQQVLAQLVYGRCRLLANHSVTGELGLMLGQQKEAARLANEVHQRLLSLEPEPPDEADANRLQDLAGKYRDVYLETSDRLGQLLRPEQQQRLAQICRQAFGVSLAELELIPELELRFDQRKEIISLMKRESETVNNGWREPTTVAERQQTLDQQNRAHQATLNAISERLDERQRRIWDAMIGPPFRLIIDDPERPWSQPASVP